MKVRAERDDALAAVIVEERSLMYREGPDATMDRPAHIRAASGLASVPGGIALIQDDTNFIVVLTESGEHRVTLPLPEGEGGLRQFDDARGNKKFKLDLEACVAVQARGETWMLALGSGSKRRREQVAIVRGWDADSLRVSLVHVPRLYDTLRRERAFAGSELNVEGAVVLGDRVRLFGRGNGEARAGLRPINATCDLDAETLLAHVLDPASSPPPAPTNITAYELGATGDVPYTFTDATAWRDSLLYCAAAEASPDATRDGPVGGSALGIIEGGSARWTPVLHASGAMFTGKIEGLATAPGINRLYAVVDADDPASASRLLTIELRRNSTGRSPRT